jgi:hypothetical protein
MSLRRKLEKSRDRELALLDAVTEQELLLSDLQRRRDEKRREFRRLLRRGRTADARRLAGEVVDLDDHVETAAAKLRHLNDLMTSLQMGAAMARSESAESAATRSLGELATSSKSARERRAEAGVRHSAKQVLQQQQQHDDGAASREARVDALLSAELRSRAQALYGLALGGEAAPSAAEPQPQHGGAAGAGA